MTLLRPRMRRLSCALALLALALTAPAQAQGPSGAEPLLWATVNVCDTDEQPDTIGIRGSMPGTGRAEDRLYMRFVVQFQAPDRSWRELTRGGESEWELVGQGSSPSRQSGRSFRVRPPDGSARMRGLVRFEWRRAGRALRRAARATTAGHRSTAGADPEGYSRAACVIEG